MDYVYNGNTRAKTVVVDFKDSEGVSVTGYPKTYNITDAFTDPGAPLGQPGTAVAIGAITNVQLARLTKTQYMNRLNAFYNMLESANPQLDRSVNVVPGFEPTGTSSSCPIGEEGSDSPDPID